MTEVERDQYLASFADYDATAYHEAGHAVMAHIERLPIVRATIVADVETKSLGMVTPKPAPRSMDRLSETYHQVRSHKRIEKAIRMILAGGIAEKLHRGEEPPASGLTGDEQQVYTLALWLPLGGLKSIKAWIEWQRVRVAETLEWDDNWRRVEAVAQGLLDYETLSGLEIKRIIKALKG